MIKHSKWKIADDMFVEDLEEILLLAENTNGRHADGFVGKWRVFSGSVSGT